MNAPDDRLAGDLVWELFPQQTSEHGASRPRRLLSRLTIALLVVLTWFLSQPFSVAVACLAIALKDFQEGRRLAKAIPDKAGGRICSLFTYSWGAWKVGVMAVTAFAVIAAVNVSWLKKQDMPPGAMMAMILVLCGFMTSSILTAAGLVKALRSRMRVWIGEGMTQDRTLLFSMLLVGFTVFVLGPLSLWLADLIPPTSDSRGSIPTPLAILFGCLLVAPIVILVVLDWLSGRVIADRPGKFGPKTPTVGKWDA
jgi:hypothetical protein